jgi:hypothetical protein
MTPLSLLSLTVSRPTTRFVLISALLLNAASCDKVPLLAPTQSTITLSISTTIVPINGTAEVVATVTEQAGTPVQNGTLVTFTTSVGSLDPVEARTDRGMARTTFRSGSQSGVARISAFSGGARTATDAQLEVRVGGAAAGRIVLRADPPNVPTTGGTTTITATVFDNGGNTLPGAPVTFSANAGSLSSGQAVSDANGEARTTLTSNRTTTVRAVTGGTGTGSTAVEATFEVTVVTLPSVTITTTQTALEAGIPIRFTVTPASSTTGNPLREVIVDFGDNQTANLGAITSATAVDHTYARPGTYQVRARATDTQGLTGESSMVITVLDRGSIQVTLTATPNPVSIGSATQQGLVDFTATTGGFGGGVAVVAYTWDFGDGTGTTTTGNTANHRYSTPNTYIARVHVRATNGQEGFAERTIRVNP